MGLDLSGLTSRARSKVNSTQTICQRRGRRREQGRAVLREAALMNTSHPAGVFFLTFLPSRQLEASSGGGSDGQWLIPGLADNEVMRLADRGPPGEREAAKADIPYKVPGTTSWPPSGLCTEQPGCPQDISSSHGLTRTQPGPFQARGGSHDPSLPACKLWVSLSISEAH